MSTASSNSALWALRGIVLAAAGNPCAVHLAHQSENNINEQKKSESKTRLLQCCLIDIAAVANERLQQGTGSSLVECVETGYLGLDVDF